MAAKGAAALSDAELLAILIGSGSADESAVTLMQRLMKDCNNNLNTLGKMSLSDLTGEVETMAADGKVVRNATKDWGSQGHHILAACELGKRRSASQAEERKLITEPNDLYAYFHPHDAGPRPRGMLRAAHEPCGKGAGAQAHQPWRHYGNQRGRAPGDSRGTGGTGHRHRALPQSSVGQHASEPRRLPRDAIV
jgi:hypothetical protein